MAAAHTSATAGVVAVEAPSQEAAEQGGTRRWPSGAAQPGKHVLHELSDSVSQVSRAVPPTPFRSSWCAQNDARPCSHAPSFRDWVLRFTPVEHVDVASPLYVFLPPVLACVRGRQDATTDERRVCGCCCVSCRALHQTLATVFTRMWGGNLRVYSPDCLLKVVWKLFPQFTGFKQQVCKGFFPPHTHHSGPTSRVRTVGCGRVPVCVVRAAA